jgi:hypothetical protein
MNRTMVQERLDSLQRGMEQMQTIKARMEAELRALVDKMNAQAGEIAGCEHWLKVIDEQAKAAVSSEPGIGE